ncbi:mandelate racemase/muconate lactonizing enzyme family protein [Granulosicoccus antarcticus]|uniref:L-talarate/galactarate dehydratase n=1 Tax=Granulosicoccus antarcticus IMCC3135 TaxID=1192854 RepID=A0A2Z2NZI1_9GAMM|nr:mandelate racemase/muconate lactonizing enzyme family protein [Granulosicoccus antarcticus]ASJ73217.1 L-talarate/galactarate dehydratase [Granulosicoccus antarcticus IMCC3135]
MLSPRGFGWRAAIKSIGRIHGKPIQSNVGVMGAAGMNRSVATDTSVKISKIDVWSFREPIERVVATSFGRMTDRRCVLVRIEDRDGCFGFGEIFANWPVAAPENRARLLAEDLAWLLLGREISSPTEMFDYLVLTTRLVALQAGEFGPFQQAIAGLDIAINDLFARKADMSLARYLAADTAPAVPVYASGIHIDSADEMIAAARQVGFTRFKVKVGFDTDAEPAKLTRLVETLRKGETLMVDANQAWNFDQARNFAHATQSLGLGWIEEPMPVDANPAQWRDLATVTDTPLAGGENLAGFAAFEQAIDERVLSIIQPDVAKWGGVSGCLAVGFAAKAQGKTYCPHFLGGGVGLMASAHVLAACAGGWLETDVNDSVLRSAFDGLDGSQITNGTRQIDTSPGMGITFLPAAITPFLTSHYEVSQ